MMTRRVSSIVTFALSSFCLSSACEGRPKQAPMDGPAPSTVAPEPAPSAAPPVPIAAPRSPYVPKAHVYKGQLHAHTTNSDGRQSPAAVMAAYRAAGYAFVAITDHDFNTPDPGVPGILFLPGVENDFHCQHENRIDATTWAPGDRRPQDVIDQARREGSFVQINHPDWPGQYPANPCWSDQALLAVSDYDAVEAWNASDDWRNDNAERRIDHLLSHGRRTFLTAVDDCHDVHAAYCMTSSVRVFADALTAREIMAGLKGGNFYASSGAAISSVSLSGTTVTVVLPEPGTIEFVTDGGRVAKTVHDAVGTYAFAGADTYARVRVTDARKRKAWTNPVYAAPAR